MQKMTSLSLPLPLPLCILFILMETLRLDSQECQPWSRGASGRPTDRPTEGTTERAASTTYNEKHRLRPRRRRGAGRTEGREDGGGRRRTRRTPDLNGAPIDIGGGGGSAVVYRGPNSSPSPTHKSTNKRRQKRPFRPWTDGVRTTDRRRGGRRGR